MIVLAAERDMLEPPQSGGLWSMLRCNGWSMFFGAVLTIGVCLAVFVAAHSSGASYCVSLLSMLATTAVWTAIVPACWAAGASDTWSKLLRGSAILDANGVSLLMVWALGSPGVADVPIDLYGVLKVYCILTAMGLVSVAAVCVFRRSSLCAAVALAMAFAGMVALASPFWIHVWIVLGDKDATAWAVRINPFYAICAALIDSLEFLWHGHGMLYDRLDWLEIGSQLDMTSYHWYDTPLLCLIPIGVFAVLGIVRCIGHSKRTMPPCGGA